MRIGLLGLGTVGGAVVELLAHNQAATAAKAGTELTVAKALVRRLDAPRSGAVSQVPLTTDPHEILGDPTIELIVEVLGGIHPAYEYVSAALRGGKSVVTANKDLIAEHGHDLAVLARDGGGELYFEASVGGGIPLLRPLQESLGGNHIDAIMGIVNGTTNYMLTQMSQLGQEYAVALQEAQALGYAEANPASDVEGYDAARKLAILATLGFNTRVAPAQVYTEGITQVTARDIAYGQRFGWVIKLLAIGKLVNGEVEARVHPTFVPTRHPLARIDGPFNAVFVRGDAVGETMFYGRGAGGMPTASSVVGDLIAAARQRGAGCGALAKRTGYALDQKLLPMRDRGDVISGFYVRLDVLDQPGVLAKVASAFGEQDVSIAQMLQTAEADGLAEIVLITHQVTERQMSGTLQRLKELPVVREVAGVIRVEEMA